MQKITRLGLGIFFLLLLVAGPALSLTRPALGMPTENPPVPPVIDTSPPDETAKLVFVHASVGEAWLAPGLLGSSREGYSGVSLMENNYFVSDLVANNYPDFPGHDYCQWPASLTEYWDTLVNHSSNEGYYERLPDPGGENDIIMIKPCFIQYPITGNPDDPPTGLHGCPHYETSPGVWENKTVGNVKQALLDSLEIAGQHPDKFFVFVTAPPMTQEHMTHGEHARAIANWMVNDLLDGYAGNNVLVFDLFNLLTSNAEGPGDTCQEWSWGDDLTRSDVGFETGNHHRIWQGQVQHQIQYDQTYSAYCENHPKANGLYKATREFVPLLNAYYNAWLDGAEQCSSVDLDCDCDVDVTDIQIIANGWRCEVGDQCYQSRYDLDGDSVVDILDVMHVSMRFGCACGDACYTF